MVLSAGGSNDEIPFGGGDLLLGGDDDNSPNLIGTTTTSAEEGAPNNSQGDMRQLQLPRVGWGTDNDGNDGGGSTTNTEIPSVNNNNNSDNVSVRSHSRNSQEVDLAPIPEDMSMHGDSSWMSDYDYYYDDRRRYRYRRVGPNFYRRLCAVILIVFAAIVGSKMGRVGDKKKKQIIIPEQSSESGNIAEDDNNAGVESNNSDNTSENDDLVYQMIVDTLDPLVFDDSSKSPKNEWDGSFFQAFEFCGKNFSRVPCPYVAYCPLGPGKAPFGGARIDVGSSWAPIYKHSRENGDEADWVSLGNVPGICDLYSQQNNGEQPAWGDISAEAKDKALEITRHLMCCLEPTDDDSSNSIKVQIDRPYGQPASIDLPPSLEEDEMQKPIPIRAGDN